MCFANIYLTITMKTLALAFVLSLLSAKADDAEKSGSVSTTANLTANAIKRRSHNFPDVWTIGAVLSSPERVGHFIDAVEQENNAPAGSRRLPTGIRLNSTQIIMDVNPIRAAKTVCDVLIPNKPYVVIASQPILHSDLAPMAVSFTCGFYKIPVIGLSARESTFSDKVRLCFVCCDMCCIFFR